VPQATSKCADTVSVRTVSRILEQQLRRRLHALVFAL
jgi:hypothetical protein